MDVFRSQRGRVEDSGASINVSYFHERLSHMNSSNKLADFDSFYWEASHLCLTLPMLLRNKKKIVDIINRWLVKADKYTRSLLLELIPELAHDLQHVFYDHFGEIVEQLVAILNPDEPEEVEEVLTCVAFLLKFLRKALVNNIEQVFDLYRPFFGHKKAYVRDFAAQSLAFLFRKMDRPALEKCLDVLWVIVRTASEEYADSSARGVGSLLYHLVRGFSGRMHSRSGDALVTILDSWEKNVSTCALSSVSLEVMFSECATFVRESSAGVKDLVMVWDLLVERLAKSKSSLFLRFLSCLVRAALKEASLFHMEKVADILLGLDSSPELQEMLLEMCKSRIGRVEKPSVECLQKVAHAVIARLEPERRNEVLGWVVKEGINMIWPEVAACFAEELFKSPPTKNTFLFYANARLYWPKDLNAVLTEMVFPCMKNAAFVKDALELCRDMVLSNNKHVKRDVVLKQSLACEKQFAGNVMVMCAAFRVTHACGVGRHDACVELMQKSPGVSECVEALGDCVDATRPWKTTAEMVSDFLVVRDFHARQGALKVLSKVCPDVSFFRIILEVIGTNFLVHDSDALSAKTKISRIGEDLERIVKDPWVLRCVIKALVGCLYYRYVLVSEGAKDALQKLAKRNETWEEVASLLSKIADDKEPQKDEEEEEKDDTSTFDVFAPVSSRILLRVVFGLLKQNVKQVERFHKLYVPLHEKHLDSPKWLRKWLGLFGKFTKLASKVDVPSMTKLTESLLCHKDIGLQRKALKVYLKLVQDEHLQSVAEVLTSLTPSKGKDLFNVLIVGIRLSEIVEPKSRAHLIRIASDLLFPRALHSCGMHGMGKRVAKAVFDFFGRAEEGELDRFVGHMFGHLDKQGCSKEIARMVSMSMSSWQGKTARYQESYVRAAKLFISVPDARREGLRLVTVMMGALSKYSAMDAEVSASLAQAFDEGLSKKWWRQLFYAACRFGQVDTFLEQKGVLGLALTELLSGSDAELMKERRQILDAICSLVPTSPEDKKTVRRFRRILEPHVEKLLDLIEQQTHESFALSGFFAELLGHLVRVTNQTERVLDILIPVASSIAEDVSADDRERKFVSTLDLVLELQPRVGSESVLSKLVEFLELLPLVMRDRKMCLKLCQVLEAVCKMQNSSSLLQQAMSGLLNMMAFSQVVLDEVDVNRRLMGLEKAAQLIPELDLSDGRDETPTFLVLFYPVLLLCFGMDLGVREQALSCLTSLLGLSHRGHGTACPPCVEQRVIPQALHCLVSDMPRTVHHSAMQVVRFCVSEWPAHFPDLSKLLDDKGDCFTNLFNTTFSLRTQALKSLQHFMQTQDISDERVLSEFFLPIIKHGLFGHMMERTKKEDLQALESNLLETLEILGKRLTWDTWREVAHELCSIFSERGAADPAGLEMRTLCRFVDSFQGEGDAEFLLQIVGPLLEKNIFLKKKGPERKGGKGIDKGLPVNCVVVVSLLRMFQLLGETVVAERVPPVLRNICNSLSDRDEKVRETTRDAIVQICLALGTFVIEHFVGGMRSALKVGFEIHVLFFSIHHLLSATQELCNKTTGALDRLAGPLSALLLEDILGLTSMSRQVGKVQSSTLEARGEKSFHTFELLARAISFPSAAWEETAFQQLMQPVVDMLQFSKRPSDIEALRSVLESICSGVGTNPTLTVDAGMVYSFALVSQNLRDSAIVPSVAKGKNAAKEYIKMHAAAIEEADKRRRELLQTLRDRAVHNTFLVEQTKREQIRALEDTVDHFATNRVLLAEFGYRLLSRLIPKQRKDNVAFGAQLDPFVELCVLSLKQNEDMLAELAISCLMRISSFRRIVPAFEKAGRMLVAQILEILRRTDPSGSLGRLCLQFLATMADINWELRDEEISFLLQLIYQELESFGDLKSALVLLHRLISMQVLQPEVYDLMTLLHKQIVAAVHDDVRRTGSSIFAEFLVTYPMKERKRQQYIERMIRDLSMEDLLGREAAVELFKIVYAKYPDASSLAEVAFVPLVIRLSCEEDRNLRNIVASSIKVLVSRLGEGSAHDLFLTCISWLEKEAPVDALRVAAAQVIGFFAECLSPEDVEHAVRVLEELAQGSSQAPDLEWILSAVEQRQKLVLHDAWLYQLCASLEKLVLVKNARLVNVVKSADFFCSLFEYAHAWVRACGARLLELVISQLKWDISEWCKLREKLCVCIQQAKEQAVIDVLLRDLLLSLSRSDSSSSSYAPSPQMKRVRSNSVLDADDMEDEEAKAQPSVVSEDAPIHEEFPLPWTFWRLSNMLLGEHVPDVVKAGVFKWFAAMLSKVNKEEAYALLPWALRPIYAVYPWDMVTKNSEMSELCSQVLDYCKGLVGVERFVQACNKVRDEMSTKSREDRQMVAAEFVTDQVHANRKKLKRALENKQKKQKRFK